MDAFNFEALKSALLGPVQKTVNTKDERTQAALLNLQKVFEEVSDKIDKMARAQTESAKEHAKAAINTHKNNVFKKGGGSGKSLGKLGENVWGSRRALERIVKMGASPRTFWVGIGHYHSQALKQLTDAFRAAGCCGGGGSSTAALKEVARSASRTGTSGGKGGALMGPAVGEGGGGAAMGAVGHASKAWLTSFAANAANILAMALGHGFELSLTDAFSGAFKAANNFRMEIRAIKQATEGFVESNRAMEPMFEGIYHTLRASGVTANKVFEMISKAQKIGIRDSRIAQSIVGTATNTASILGMEAGAVNDVFMSWHQQLGLSSLEISQMGQNMKEIAKQSGVMGKRLESALMSADKIAEKLRNAGSFTATAGRNVTSMMVEFEKFGVGAAGSKIIDALASRHSFLETDPITRGYLERVARQSGNGEIQQRVRGGTLLHSQTASKEFFGAMEKDMKRMLGHFGPAIEKAFAKSGRKFDLATVKMEEIPEIFDVLREQGEHQLYGVVSDLIKRQTGMDVGEITRMVQAGQNATKTTTDRIADMQKDLAGFTKGTANYQQKEQQILQAQVNEIQGGFTELYGLQKNRRGMNDVQFQDALIKKLSDSMGPERAKEFAKNLSGEAGKMIQGLAQRADTVGINANKVIKELGGYKSMEDLAMGVSKGDMNAQETMNKLIQRVEQQEKVAADPIESIKDNVKGIHDWLTTGIYGTLKGIGDTGLSILGWVGLLSPIAFGIFKIWSFMSFLGKTKNFLGNLMSGGGRGAATASRAGRASTLYPEYRALAGGSELAEAGAGAGAAGGRGLLGKLTGVLGKIAGPLQLLVGGITGYFEADESKRMKSEGALFGALTGGAGTGSFASGILGLEKGGAADKALGVAGGAAWGAAAGAAIGAAFFGVGAAPGALIGALVGAISEIIKIVSDGTTLVYDILIKPFDSVWMAVKDIVGGLWDVVAGIFTLDPKRMFSGLGDILMAIPNMQKRIIQWVTELPGNIFRLLVTGVKKWFNYISGIVKSLAEDEIFGPIFKPIMEYLDMLGQLGRELSELWSTVTGIFDPIIKAFNELKTQIFGAIDIDMWKVFKNVLWGVSTAVGFLIQAALWPLKTAIEIVSGVIAGAVDLIKTVINSIPFLKKEEGVKVGGPDAEKLAPPVKIQGFADGSSGITQAGLAFIHKDEMIIPGNMSVAQGEPLRGSMNPNNMNYDDIEDVVAKQVYGESPDGSAMILPSMDAIAEYLTSTQFMLLENMVDLMEAIKNNTAGSSSPDIIGSNGGGNRLSMRPGVKSMARDLTRGKWDLTFADNAPGSVTTEGRGGSA